MTSPVNSSNVSQPNYQGIGVPDESIGNVLQRGGEELILHKVPDRFTVRLSPSTSGIKDLPQPPIPMQHANSVPPALEEVTVAPNQLDEAMALARNSEYIDFASHVYQLDNDPSSVIYLTNQLTIQFQEDVDASTRESITSEVGLKELKPIEGIPNGFVYEITTQAQENPLKIANRLTRNTQVLLAEPNIVIRSQPHYVPRDSLYSKQWYLHCNEGNQMAAGCHISAEQAWDITRGVRSIVVAISDDSVDINHPDFQGVGKIVAPLDLKGRDNLPLPEAPTDNHGTACAGVAVAEENGKGIVGVAPGCALMPIRTTGFLDDESVEQIFNWAIDKGASVISCSWGASAIYFPLSVRQKAVINKAATKGRQGKGCVIIFAAGNANRPINGILDESGWPNDIIKGRVKWLSGFAVHPDVIAVSASNSLGKKSAYSNWGTGVCVCAPSNNAPPGMWLQETGYIGTPPVLKGTLPGLGVFTTDRMGAAGYDQSDFTPYFGGTSSATPVVAGVAALVLSANPNLTAQEVRRILEQSSDKIVDSDPDPQLGIRMGNYDKNGYSQWFGYGKVNAFKAVQMAQNKRMVQQQISRNITKENNQSLAIPDNNPKGLSSSIAITETSPIQDIQVTVEIEHSFLGDLEVWLVAPNGDKVLLQNRTLGVKTQLKTTYTLQNTLYLRQFLNLPAQGNWQLRVIDAVAENTGTLKYWKLDLGL
ncbi:S8 family serine peptidase [Planktothrix mougeotii]|uniref:S8 family serine peptidase n=1 Tax=Planktothrix mougeotii LEGE 06226 TaxID=1828728 RepID=A0ABR9UJ22_9CYAN|nr:S8 family serine peptidase [Planktothrix mougeotii]MBE9146470.1 S8 family serine peptidase [Planktothrix mougeotii LEGE 06226]